MKNTENHFEVLRRIKKAPELTQRKLAADLGFSLGKLNYCVRALNQKGLIKIQHLKKRKDKINYVKKYVLTKKGIDHRIKLTLKFMKKKIKEYDELKKEIK